MSVFLEFQPETATEAKARWYLAVRKTWEWEEFDPIASLRSVLSGEYDRPGKHRENVFDFHDGLRLIVSVDKYRFGTFLHVSASPHSQKLMKKFCPPGHALDHTGLAALVHGRVLFIGDRNVTLGFYRGQPKNPINVVHCFDPPLPPAARLSDDVYESPE